MANKTIQKEELEEIKEEDITEKADFEIDKDAFRGPFICCNQETARIKKIFSLKGMEFTYEVWHCNKCNKDYLDDTQGQRFDKLLLIQKLLDENLIILERSVNFDGKTFFVRFPSQITKNWKKGSHAHIKILGPDEYLIKVEK